MSISDTLPGVANTTAYSGASSTASQPPQTALAAKVCEIFVYMLPVLATLVSATLLLATGHPLALISLLACASWTVFSLFPDLPNSGIGYVNTHTHIITSRPLWTPAPVPIYQQFTVLSVPTPPPRPTVNVYVPPHPPRTPPLYAPVQPYYQPHYNRAPSYNTVPTVVDVTNSLDALARAPVGSRDHYVDDRLVTSPGTRAQVGRGQHR